MRGTIHFTFLATYEIQGEIWPRLLGISRERQSVLTLNPETLSRSVQLTIVSPKHTKMQKNTLTAVHAQCKCDITRACLNCLGAVRGWRITHTLSFISFFIRSSVWVPQLYISLFQPNSKRQYSTTTTSQSSLFCG